MAVSHEKIVDLAGTVNGGNKTFTTPAPYVAGTIRVFVNGVEYAPDDSYFGWTEISDTEIEMTNAPLTGWRMHAFIQEAEMQGSPFHPTEV